MSESISAQFMWEIFQKLCFDENEAKDITSDPQLMVFG